MKILIDLNEADRERLGAPERMEFDPSTVTMREAIILQKGVQIGTDASSYDSVIHWLDGLRDAAKNPFAYLVLVWLALRRVGIEKDLAELDASLSKMRIEFIPEAIDPQEPGKDESSPETTS